MAVAQGHAALRPWWDGDEHWASSPSCRVSGTAVRAPPGQCVGHHRMGTSGLCVGHRGVVCWALWDGNLHCCVLGIAVPCVGYHGIRSSSAMCWASQCRVLGTAVWRPPVPRVGHRGAMSWALQYGDLQRHMSGTVVPCVGMMDGVLRCHVSPSTRMLLGTLGLSPPQSHDLGAALWGHGGPWGWAVSPERSHTVPNARLCVPTASFPPRLRCQRGGGELLFPKIGPGDCLPHDFFMALPLLCLGGEGGARRPPALRYTSCMAR